MERFTRFHWRDNYMTINNHQSANHHNRMLLFAYIVRELFNGYA